MENVSTGKVGKYEIIKVLGRGGMGEVLLAQDIDLGRRVAIKRPFKSALEEGLARFQVEAKAATLRHPNIPTVYEMGVQDGLPFIAMEFVEGEPLDKIISSGRHVDLMTKLRIIEQVCLALGYAHENGIIHRDIKPANIIVQNDGVAKIIDFGIAKVQDGDGKAGLTQTSAVIGSLHYIAPERFKGGPIDGRVDIFSAGVTLFKLLTGEEPFTGGEATASYKIVNEAHTSLGAYLHDYPPVLDEIVAKSLAKNPEDRYSTGEDFADALHDVIEELKRTRVAELFDDAERLTTESRFTPALELLEEAVKLDPANTQVRKLRKFVREHQERLRRAERLRECVLKADEFLLAGNFEDALNQLREAQNLDATSADLKQRIQAVEEKKRRFEISTKALADAETAKNRGDVTAALRIVNRALQEDPENRKLVALNQVLARQAEIEAQQGKIIQLLEEARQELAARHFGAVEKLIAEADKIDASHLETDKLRREMARIREQEERRAILDEIQKRVNEFLRTEALDQAADLLNRAIERLPNETMLHRLKAEVDSEAQKLEARRFVESAIAQARDLFATSPTEALGVLQSALDRMPGEERLLAYERSLRQQLDALQVEQVHAGTLKKARELMSARQYDKAIVVLESFQLEYGHHADMDDLLAFARDEQTRLQRGTIIERCASEGRALIREGRLDEAIQLLQAGIQETGDASLSRLLEEIREQQAAFARKLELLEKRVGLLRERGELEEAIGLLQEQLATMPGNPALQDLLAALKADQQQKKQAEFARQIEALQQRVGQMRQSGDLEGAIRLLQEQITAMPGIQVLQDLLATVKADLEHKQATAKAITAARASTQKKDFPAALASLQAVSRAYGESAELTAATQEVESERASHAQDIVGKSIESARAALLKNDPQEALAALKTATPWMEFADAKKQADWQRIGQSVKKALEQAGTTASGGAAFDAQLSAIAGAKPRKFPVALVAVAAAALLAIAATFVWKMKPAPTPTVGHITIAKAPAHAMVSIDNGTPAQADDNGSLTVEVKPGAHQLHIAADGFGPLDDKVDVNAGETVKDEVSLSKLLPAGTSGTLIAKGNAAEFKLSVDGNNMGLHHAGESIPLEIGAHKITYTAQDGSDTQEHNIQIALNKTTSDSFFLKPAAPKPASNPTNVAKQAEPTPEPKPAPPQQQLPPTPVPVVPPSGSLRVSSTSIEKGNAVQLSWDAKNTATVSITNLGDGLGPQGNQKDFPASTTKYQLIANGQVLSEQTVTVFVAPTPPTPAPTPKASGPDAATLMQALANYRGVFAQASGKNPKDCQGVFKGALQGRLKEWADTCAAAKSYDASIQSCQLGGSAEAPTFSCKQTITIHTKDGDQNPFPSQKTFRFTKSGDGNWQLSGW